MRDLGISLHLAPDGFGGGGGAGSPAPMIRHDGEEPKPQIRFDSGPRLGKHEERWQRKPNATGTGAVHMRTFHCRLAEESVDNLDKQINEWLDAHPEYEVKLVTTTVGEWVSKSKEPNLIVQVWV